MIQMNIFLFCSRQQKLWPKPFEYFLYLWLHILRGVSSLQLFLWQSVLAPKKVKMCKAAPTAENVKTNCPTNSVGVFAPLWPSAELCSKDENNTCSHHLLRNGMQWWNLCSQRARGLCKLHSAKWKAIYYVFNGIGAYLQSEEGCFI